MKGVKEMEKEILDLTMRQFQRSQERGESFLQSVAIILYALSKAVVAHVSTMAKMAGMSEKEYKAYTKKVLKGMLTMMWHVYGIVGDDEAKSALEMLVKGGESDGQSAEEAKESD